MYQPLGVESLAPAPPKDQPQRSRGLHETIQIHNVAMGIPLPPLPSEGQALAREWIYPLAGEESKASGRGRRALPLAG